MFNKFKKIEEEYAVEDIVYKNEKIWSYLRVHYHEESIKELTNTYLEKKRNNFLKKSMQTLAQIFYGFKNWFNTYEYMFFGSSQLRLEVEGTWRDRSFGIIISQLGREESLYIDTPSPEHIPFSKIDTQHIVSQRLIDSIILAIYKLQRDKHVNIDLLKKINLEKNLTINYHNIIRKFNISVRIYKLLLFIYKPKVVFISCYYSYQALIKASNDMNIQTIEMQHGLIGLEHFAYNLNKKLDSSYFPKTLLTFGSYDKTLIENNKFNPFYKVYAVGSFTLELIKQRKVPTELILLCQQYQTTISVSTQYTIEDKLALFIKKLALRDKSIGYFLSLRHFDKTYYKKFNLPDNVHLFEKEYSCYDILKACNIHLTGYSTCGIEALFFQKITLLVDIDNNVFTNSLIKMQSKNIYIVKDGNDFFNTISNTFVKEECFYLVNHKKEVIKFLNREMKNDEKD